jgi:polyphosphate kinase
MNSLVDPKMIDRLYAAAQGGAEIELYVRGICCLKPGVPGLSERIRVRSIVGRYLEHSRIFRFGEGEEARHFIGSADIMPRNLDHRVESIAEVVDPDLKGRLDEILEINARDDVLAWERIPTITRVPPGRLSRTWPSSGWRRSVPREPRARAGWWSADVPHAIARSGALKIRPVAQEPRP